MAKKKRFAANSAPRQQRRNIDYGALGMTAPNGTADTKRNTNRDFGYADNLSFYDYYSCAHRQGIGKAIIEAYPERCFAINPVVIDGDDDGEEREFTQFERDVEHLVENLHLWQRFKEAYRLNRIGQYATLIPTFAESMQVESLKQPLTRVNGVKNIRKITPYNQAQAEASTDVEDDFSSEFFGMPKYFDVNPDAIGDRSPAVSNQFELDRSRVFVIAEGANDGSIYGIPALEAPFNAIADAAKVRGAAAEGYYKNSKQRTVLNANNAEAAKVMSANKEKIDQSIDDFEGGWNAMLKTYGTDVQSLQSQLQDPTGAWTIALNDVCAASRIPLTVLIGFQNGDRSSTENNKDFNTNLQATCNNFLTPTIKQFFNWLISVGALTPPSSGKITIKWPDFLEPSKKEKLENAKLAVDTNKTAYDCNMDAVFSVGEIRELAGYDAEMEEDSLIFGEEDDEDNSDQSTAQG